MPLFAERVTGFVKREDITASWEWKSKVEESEQS